MYTSYYTDAHFHMYIYIYILQWRTVSAAVTYCMTWGGRLGCIELPGNLYLLKGTLWTGGPLRRGFRVGSRILSIIIIRFSGSSVVRILGNKLLTLGDPLLPSFIYIIYIIIWATLITQYHIYLSSDRFL
jgi:hypothetical protein